MTSRKEWLRDLDSAIRELEEIEKKARAIRIRIVQIIGYLGKAEG